MSTHGFLTPTASLLDRPTIDKLLRPVDDRLLRPIPRVPMAESSMVESSTGQLSDTGDSPLVPVAEHLATKPAYDGQVLPQGIVPLMIREAVAQRLVEAESLLPTALSLVVVDGWRTLEVQQRLIDYYGQLTVDMGFVAEVDSAKVPPHVTGGTADLTLLYQGQALALGTDFDDFSRGDRCHVAALEDEPQSVDCLLRRLLHNVLLQVGFAPYAQEWWHFSFGDENWASFYGRPGPLFGRAERQRA